MRNGGESLKRKGGKEFKPRMRSESRSSSQEGGTGVPAVRIVASLIRPSAKMAIVYLTNPSFVQRV